MSHRPARVGAQIQREITSLLQLGRIKDPRVAQLTTITGVDVSRDLSVAKVYFSVFGEQDLIESTAAGLTAAAGFIHRHLAKALHTRVVPHVVFSYDPSLVEGDRMNRLLASLPELRQDPADSTETPETAETPETSKNAQDQDD